MAEPSPQPASDGGPSAQHRRLLRTFPDALFFRFRAFFMRARNVALRDQTYPNGIPLQ